MRSVMKLQPQIAGVDGGKLLNQRLGASNLERNLQKAAVKFIEPNAVLTNPNRRGSHNGLKGISTAAFLHH